MMEPYGAIGDARYDAVTDFLTELRKERGITTRELAERIGRQHSIVTRVEHGKRRLDPVELYEYLKALDVYPDLAAAEIMRIISTTAPGGSSQETS